MPFDPPYSHLATPCPSEQVVSPEAVYTRGGINARLQSGRVEEQNPLWTHGAINHLQSNSCLGFGLRRPFGPCYYNLCGGYVG